MAQRRKGDIESALLKKGFRRVENDHSWFVYFTAEGKKSRIRTKTSHGNTGVSIGDQLLGLMARQCALTKGQFMELVDCPLSQEAFEDVASGLGRL